MNKKQRQETDTKTQEPNPLVRRFIEHAGNTTQSVGLGRVLGQLFAYLYFSPDPKNLGDMQDALGISKGSASTAVRQLEQWDAVQKVWVKGDRKDYYQATDWFGGFIRKALAETVGKKIETYGSLLDEAEHELANNGSSGDEAFIRKRVEYLRSFQMKASDAWESPLLRILLK